MADDEVPSAREAALKRAEEKLREKDYELEKKELTDRVYKKLESELASAEKSEARAETQQAQAQEAEAETEEAEAIRKEAEAERERGRDEKEGANEQSESQKDLAKAIEGLGSMFSKGAKSLGKSLRDIGDTPVRAPPVGKAAKAAGRGAAAAGSKIGGGAKKIGAGAKRWAGFMAGLGRKGLQRADFIYLLYFAIHIIDALFGFQRDAEFLTAILLIYFAAYLVSVKIFGLNFFSRNSAFIAEISLAAIILPWLLKLLAYILPIDIGVGVLTALALILSPWMIFLLYIVNMRGGVVATGVRWLYNVLIIAGIINLIVIGISNLDGVQVLPGLPELPEGAQVDATAGIQTIWLYVKDSGQGFVDSIKDTYWKANQWWDTQLAIARGETPPGQQENPREKLGLYFTGVQASNSYFYNSTTAFITGQLKGRTFEQELSVKNRCYVEMKGNETNGTISPSEKTYKAAQPIVDEPLICTFDPEENGLPAGKHDLYYETTYDFTTTAEITYHFVKESYVTNQFEAGNTMFDIRNQLDIPRRVESISSDGPILLSMGGTIEAPVEMPLVLGNEEQKIPFIIGFKNVELATGNVDTIHQITLTMPEGMKVGKCSASKEVKGPERISQGFNKYTIEADQDYKEFLSMVCEVTIEDTGNFLSTSDSGLAVKTIEAKADYRYKVKDRITLDMRQPPNEKNTDSNNNSSDSS